MYRLALAYRVHLFSNILCIIHSGIHFLQKVPREPYFLQNVLSSHLFSNETKNNFDTEETLLRSTWGTYNP